MAQDKAKPTNPRSHDAGPGSLHSSDGSRERLEDQQRDQRDQMEREMPRKLGRKHE